MGQKEIEALIAAGGAPCEICGGRMLKVDGCTWPGVYSRGKYYKRIKYGDEDFAWPDERCHDCGAKLGHYHHANCDVEQCPVCVVTVRLNTRMTLQQKRNKFNHCIYDSEKYNYK